VHGPLLDDSDDSADDQDPLRDVISDEENDDANVEDGIADRAVMSEEEDAEDADEARRKRYRGDEDGEEEEQDRRRKKKKRRPEGLRVARDAAEADFDHDAVDADLHDHDDPVAVRVDDAGHDQEREGVPVPEVGPDRVLSRHQLALLRLSLLVTGPLT
jgi:hypothetical protein